MSDEVCERSYPADTHSIGTIAVTAYDPFPLVTPLDQFFTASGFNAPERRLRPAEILCTELASDPEKDERLSGLNSRQNLHTLNPLARSSN